VKHKHRDEKVMSNSSIEISVHIYMLTGSMLGLQPCFQRNAAAGMQVMDTSHAHAMPRDEVEMRKAPNPIDNARAPPEA